MLETVKQYIKDIPDIDFDIFYQDYICEVQDQNVWAEIKNIKTEEIITLQRLLDQLNQIR